MAESTFEQKKRTKQIREQQRNGTLTGQAACGKTNYMTQAKEAQRRTIEVGSASPGKNVKVQNYKPVDTLICA